MQSGTADMSRISYRITFALFGIAARRILSFCFFLIFSFFALIRGKKKNQTAIVFVADSYRTEGFHTTCAAFVMRSHLESEHCLFQNLKNVAYVPGIEDCQSSLLGDGFNLYDKRNSSTASFDRCLTIVYF